MGSGNDFKKVSAHCLVKPGERADIASRSARFDAGLDDDAYSAALLAHHLERIADLEYKLYAEGKQSLLVVLQAMDAGGKDGAIRNVLGVANPNSCRVTAFKAPSSEELDHDFLWRVHKATPRKGEIGVFNRSHYEDVLIVRVRELVPKAVWEKRYQHINDFERLLADSGTKIVKCFLHISKDEQKERFEKRLEDPRKQWKANPVDFEERKRWDAYMEAYEDAINQCSTPWAPWYVVPADKKWFRNIVVAEVIADALEAIDPRFPPPSFDVRKAKID
ncbi:MAG: polyphosphate kinase 2 family protein [Phycisphaerales bacterium]|nr:polyphosphate kinase 2 family protein [Phycisphaerales bacterium]